MKETKIVVIYPRPTDLEAFEKAYVDEHVPIAMEKIKGVTKFVATAGIRIIAVGVNCGTAAGPRQTGVFSMHTLIWSSAQSKTCRNNTERVDWPKAAECRLAGS